MIGLVWMLIGCGDKDETPADDTAAVAAADADGDGFDTTEDCDDSNADIYPGAEELCDEVDNDCDGRLDDGVTQTWYADADGDGFGAYDSITYDCEAPADHVLVSGDCDDTDAAVNPDAEEVCDGVDNDCGGSTDEGLLILFYYDADGDGFGTDSASTEACEAPDPGYIEQGGDCDDYDKSIHPDAEEVCDGVDNDCNESTAVVTWMGADTDEEVDVSEWFTGTIDAPAEILLEERGTLTLCEGVLYASLLVDGDIDLVGAYGAESTILSGGGVSPVVTVSGDRLVSLTGLTVADGAAKLGAGVSVTGGGVLTMLDVIVENNVADKLGGGLYVDTDSSAAGEGVLFTDNDPDDISRGTKKSYTADKKGAFSCEAGQDTCQ